MAQLSSFGGMMTQNLKYWSELADIHSRGDYYPVEEVVKGGNTLRELELELLANPDGRRLLHSHCHIGLDTISLARFGFLVTGIDYSPTAVQHARRIADLAGVQGCKFLVADSSEPADPTIAGTFDIYYASYGVLVWVPDVEIWFKSAATYLMPGGELVLIDESTRMLLLSIAERLASIRRCLRHIGRQSVRISLGMKSPTLVILI